jgi:hypothetical protein
VDALQVAAGVGFTLFLVEGKEEDFERIPVWQAETLDNLPTMGAAIEEEEKGSKRKGGAGGKGGAKKART